MNVKFITNAMPTRPPIHRPLGIGDRQQQRRTYDQTRDKQEWRGWYKTARWQRKREAQLRDEPLCAICMKAGRLTPATVCDHIERHGGEPDAINKAVAAFAKQELHRVIAEGVASPDYERYVNGVADAPEEAYRAPGAIVYEFTNWPLVINAALAELQKRAPRKSGRFAASFIVIAGGQIVTNYRSIPAEAEVIVVNFQPYTRKAETGLLKQPKRYVFDGTKRSLARRFSGVFRFETRFLNIASGVHPEIPYILKGNVRVRAAAQNSRSSAFRAGRATLASRKDTAVGQPLTYPAIVINSAT